jgi:tetratricopeptide (TPR) repeat protein
MKIGLSAKVFAAAVLVLFASCCVHAQGSQLQGSLGGTVTDSDGKIVVGATVTLKNLNANYISTFTTDSNGTYQFNGLPPAQYGLTAEKAGFKTIVLEHVKIIPGQRNALNLQLQEGKSQSAPGTTSDASLTQSGLFRSAGGSDLTAASGNFAMNRAGNIAVYVRTEDGEPLSPDPKLILIDTEFNGQYVANLPKAQKGPGDSWIFPNVDIDEPYEVQVQAPGYHTELRAVTVPDSADASASIIVFMRSPNDELAFHPPSGQFVLAPQAEKEAQKGAEDMDSGRLDSAEKHLNKALKVAPDNPYLNYLMGMRFLLDGELPAAKPYLEKSVSADARQAPALAALGTLRFRQGDYPGAIHVLAPAAQLNPSKWKVHSMLASSYLKEKDYEQARDEAERALSLGGAQANRDQLVLGEALAGLGQREKAVLALETFLKQNPGDANDAAIRAWLPDLEKPQAVSAPAVPVTLAVPEEAIDLPPRENWAPPDIDAEKPFIVSGVACSLPKVLKSAGKNATQLVADLQEFSANEKYESVEIKRDQDLEKTETETFKYLMFIEKPRPDVINVQEMRDQGVNAEDVPGRSLDSDAALALVFHPALQDDFAWSCEGLGEWKDKPAWIVRFEQRKDRPNHLATFQIGPQVFPLPLKGRAWIAENSGQVMHLEADLMEPVVEAKLLREHFAIDYKPVAFRQHKVTLWLPEDVDVYLQLRGHYLHHYHHFSDFQLFWTGATQKIGQPKEAANKNGAKDNPN